MTNLTKTLKYAKSSWHFAVEVYEEWNEDNCFRLAAALSYYTVFSLAPIILIATSIAGAIFGRDAVSGQFYHQMSGMIGADGAKAIEGLVQNSYLEKTSLLGTIIGGATLVLSATVTFSVIQDSLNTIWKVKARPKMGIIRFVLTRVLSFSMVLGIGFLLMVSLVINTVIVALEGYIARVLNDFSVYLINIAQVGVSLAVITLLFGAMYKFLPDVRISWRKVWKGALLTAVLFTLGKYLIGLYLGHSNLASTYGAAASVIVIMLWVNYSSWIFFIGAEYIYVRMRRDGNKIVPNKYAIRLHIQEVEEEV